MSQHSIELKRLCRYFGKKAVVDDLSLAVQTGKVTALLGLNGAGKTTTIRILMGLLSPTRGSATTLGSDATTMSIDTRKRIGYLVEGHYLYPSMRVKECQKFQRAGYDSWNSNSRGQRAGVSLAMVLAPDPELLVLDDPALGLDPVSRRALNETLIEFAGGGKRTVLLSTHLLDDVERIADRVAVMVGGRLKVDTSMDDFVSRVSLFSVESNGDDNGQSVAETIPGLIEVRQVGDRLQMAIADANGVAHEAIEKDHFERRRVGVSDASARG